MAARRGVHIIQLHDPQPPLLGRAMPPQPPPPPHLADDPALLRRLPTRPSEALAALEDRLASRDHDTHALLADNQRLAAVHVALKQQLLASQHELRLGAVAAAKARAEKEAELREVLERSMRAEAEARAVEAMRAELARVRADVERLELARNELGERLGGLRAELARAQAGIGQAAAVGAEIEAMHHEIQKGRAAVEFEKKAHAENSEQGQLMESKMVSMAGEIEKLRAELDNAEKRALAAAAAAAAAYPAGNLQHILTSAAANPAGNLQHMSTATTTTAGNLQHVLTAAVANPGNLQHISTAATANPAGSLQHIQTVAAANTGYAASYGNSGLMYGASSYADPYSLHQIQRATDGTSQYGAGTVSYVTYDAQQTQNR